MKLNVMDKKQHKLLSGLQTSLNLEADGFFKLKVQETVKVLHNSIAELNLNL